MSKLKNQCIWLTGASSGIGRALAFELIRRGARCALTARNGEALSLLINEIETDPDRTLVVTGDVTDADVMKQVATEIHEKFGAIDMLIANAGTHIFTRPENFDSAEYLSLMDINYGGMLRCIEAVLPHMRTANRGSIVGVASLAGYRGLPRAAAYGASKAAMIHFLESLRFHLEREKIDVTIVNPGFVRTPLTDQNDFHMPFLIDADRAATTICNQLERGKRKISFPIPFNWTLEAMRIIPDSLYQFIVKSFVWKD